MQTREEDRLLYALKARGPQTAQQLAARLGVSAAAVRQRLERLHASGLLAFDDDRGGVGRPKRIWQLSAAGHGRFPDNHAGLSLEMIESVRRVFGEPGLEQLIQDREAATRNLYAERLAGAASLRDKVERLAQVRSEEGYMAEVAEADDGALLLVENHCPICVAARACQGFCRSELAIFQAVLAPDATVERTEHLLQGARRCAYRVVAR